MAYEATLRPTGAGKASATVTHLRAPQTFAQDVRDARDCDAQLRTAPTRSTDESDKEHWENTRVMYIKTMADMQRFKDRGYVVSYMWEHEHKAATRAKKPLLPVVRYL